MVRPEGEGQLHRLTVHHGSILLQATNGFAFFCQNGPKQTRFPGNGLYKSSGLNVAESAQPEAATGVMNDYPPPRTSTRGTGVLPTRLPPWVPCNGRSFGFPEVCAHPVQSVPKRIEGGGVHGQSATWKGSPLAIASARSWPITRQARGRSLR